MSKQLVITSSPHIRDKETISRIMWWVVISLIPAGISAVWVFGLPALYLIVACVVSAVLTELACQKVMGRPVRIGDGSAVITGLLLAYNVSAGLPLWMAVLGSVFAIAIGKQVFGGLGRNIFNPALVGRAFLMASFPAYMTRFYVWKDGALVSQATPLTVVKMGGVPAVTYKTLFLGNYAGCIGETSVLALLIGALILLWRGYISLHTPLSYIGTVALMTWIFGGKAGWFSGDWLFHILSGGLMLGAWFMATDMVTSPITKKGQVAFGIGCGLITSILRLWGGLPEGVSYSILIMNAFVPYLDNLFRPRRLGERRRWI